MSKLETPMTCRFWQKVGGTLIEEYPIVKRGPDTGHRNLDAIIIADGECRIASRKERLSLDGHNIIIVQTKASRLGMHLLGQAYYSRKLVLRRFSPQSVRSVALRGGDDAILREFAEEDGIEVVIDDKARKCPVPAFPVETNGNNIIVKINRRLGMYCALKAHGVSRLRWRPR